MTVSQKETIKKNATSFKLSKLLPLHDKLKHNKK